MKKWEYDILTQELTRPRDYGDARQFENKLGQLGWEAFQVEFRSVSGDPVDENDTPPIRHLVDVHVKREILDPPIEIPKGVAVFVSAKGEEADLSVR